MKRAIAPIPFAGSQPGEIRTLIDIMRTHLMVIIGGILQQNPFLVPQTSSVVNFANAGMLAAGYPRRPDIPS
jgi:hypothetical protein